MTVVLTLFSWSMTKRSLTWSGNAAQPRLSLESRMPGANSALAIVFRHVEPFDNNDRRVEFNFVSGCLS